MKRMRRFLQLLQDEGNRVRFDDLSRALRDGMEDSSVYLANKRGKLLTYALEPGLDSTEFDMNWLDSGFLPEELNDSLLKVGAVTKMMSENGQPLLVSPVISAGKRVGSLLFSQPGGAYTEEDMAMNELAAVSIGMIISHALDGEEEGEAMDMLMARSAINSLSYSEILAMQRIFDELKEDEGLLVASRIADNAGITRSVIVNALRKLASANVVESRSLGMKGTYLRVLNKEIRAEFERRRYPYPKEENKQA